MITITITITSLGVNFHDAFIPILRSGGPHWGPVKLIRPSVCKSVSLSLCLSTSLPICQIIHVFFLRIFVRPVIACITNSQSPWGKIP